MIIELTLLNSNKPIAVNINHIKAIYKDKGKTLIYCSYISEPFEIKESYEEVIEAINLFKILGGVRWIVMT